MARGRMISNSTPSDKRINDLCDDTSRLAFTWLVTFADVEGRTYGDPGLVRSMLFPRRSDVTVERMEKYITEWAAAGMIIWYEADGDLWIAFPNFEKHQSLRKDREPASNIPAPPDDFGGPPSPPSSPDDNPGGDPTGLKINGGSLPDECRMNAGSVPEQIQVKLKEEKLIEVKLRDNNNGGGDGGLFGAYENEIGIITPAISDLIKEWETEYPEGWPLEAIGIAARSNNRRASYVTGILENWRKYGRDAGKPTRSNGHSTAGAQPSLPAPSPEEIRRRLREAESFA